MTKAQLTKRMDRMGEIMSEVAAALMLANQPRLLDCDSAILEVWHQLVRLAGLSRDRDCVRAVLACQMYWRKRVWRDQRNRDILLRRVRPDGSVVSERREKPATDYLGSIFSIEYAARLEIALEEHKDVPPRDVF